MGEAPEALDYTIIQDEADGHRRLEPIPTGDALSTFYQSAYYHLLKSGGRAPDIRRLLAGGESADRERAWLTRTLYRDVADLIDAHADGRRVLEVGCGVGLMLDALAEDGFEVTGVEPSVEAVEIANARGASYVQRGTLRSFIDEGGAAEGFDAVVLINVLEHVPAPDVLMAEVKSALRPGGVAVVRVPNDFSDIQRAARDALDTREWWVAVPDHIHYFNFETLSAFMANQGLEVVHATGDFPMELFLLMGDNYVDHPEQGGACHQRRVNLENNLPTTTRRALNAALAEAGIGRNCLVVAKDALAPEPWFDLTTLDVTRGPYRYVGFRREDIYPLRHFRNAQIDVLRQKRPLTEADQERWYSTLVAKTHDSPDPRFLLASILVDGAFIGYGGLTNIDQEHKRAEISFLVDPARAGDPALYREDFLSFLAFLKGWAFETLRLHRLHSETFAFRAAHMGILEEAGLSREGRLVDHIEHPPGSGMFVDSILHGVTRDT